MCQLKNFHSPLFFSLVSLCQERYLPHTNQRYLTIHLHPEPCLPSEFGLFVYLLSFNFFPSEKEREWEKKLIWLEGIFCFLFSALATMLQQTLMPNGNLLMTEINTKLLWRIVSISAFLFLADELYVITEAGANCSLDKVNASCFSGNNFNNIYHMPTPGHAVWQHVTNIRPI